MGKCASNICRLCQESEESIEHLFVTCERVKNLWANIKHFSSINQIGELSIKSENILLGEWNKKQASSNIIYLTTKHYIFNCTKKETIPNFHRLQLYIKKYTLNRSSYIK